MKSYFPMIDYKSIDKRQWTCLNKEGDAGSGLIYTNPEEPDVILKTSRRAQEASRDNIIKEFYAAKAVYDLGMIEGKGKEDLAAFLLG